MPGWSIRTSAAKGTARKDTLQRDPDVLAAFLEDAAHFPGGHAEGLIVATSEADIANALAGSAPVLSIGAQSSLTGGATPMGETLITTSRLNHILEIGTDTVRVEAGVTLADLDAALRNAGRYYPPTPTFMGAFVGGTIATNAAGAATFKYGTTRDWVQAITVVLPDGDVLDIERGAVVAHADGYFEIAMARRHGPRPGAAVSPAAGREARGRLLRRDRAWISSISSSAPKARSASSRKRRCACYPCGRRCAWRSCRSRRARRARARAAAARSRPRHVAHEGSAAASTSRPSSTWTRAAWSCCARTASIARRASTSQRRPRSRCSSRSSCRPARRREQAFDEIGGAREPEAARRPAPPLLPPARRGRRARRRGSGGAWRSGAGEPAAGGARGRAGGGQSARRAARSGRSTRASRKPRPT